MSALNLQPIDLLLEQGTDDELRVMRSRVAEDPTLALEVADTIALLEQLRTVRTEPSVELPGKLYAIVRRAERTRRAPQPRLPLLLAAAAASAALGFCLANWWYDSGAAPASIGLPVAELPRVPAAADANRAAVPTAAELAHRDSLGAMRRRFELESADHLTAALDSAVHAERDPLNSWLAPRNALAIRRLDHELRTRPEIRQRALRSEGAMLAADARVQALADAIAEELTLGSPLQVSTGSLRGAPTGVVARDVALGVRALIAAGVKPGVRQRAFLAGSRWLGERLPELVGEDRVSALAALVECAAIEGRPMPVVVSAGHDLVEGVLCANEDTWQRRRPYLLSHSVSNSAIGDAGHTLTLLPALGVDAVRCGFVRLLLLGELKERRDADVDGPDLLAAMIYGFGDLMSERERDALVLQLRRWKPARLAPDFVTVHQIAWGVEPGRSGFTRLQRELRQLVILPDPLELGPRAAMCMSLASNFAARRPQSLERFLHGG